MGNPWDDTPTPPPFAVRPAADADSTLGLFPPNRKRARYIKVLLIEDNPGDARLIREKFDEVGATRFELYHSDRLATGLRYLAEREIDVVLLDLSLPDCHGLDTFRQAYAQARRVPIVVLSNVDDATLAVSAVQEGAQDYLVKSRLDGNLLVRSIRYAVERTRRRHAEERLRATDEELRIAREIQQRLFPATAPDLAGFDIGGASFPAQATGGDYFDYISMLDKSLGIVIADVSGHGFGPALLMAETRALLRAFLLTRTDVGEIVGLVNRALVPDVSEDHFVTLLFARLDPRTRSFTYASAGHPTAYILDRSGQVKTLLNSTSFPLGLEPQGDFPAAPPLTLDPGELVFFLTDGVTEARAPDDTPFGIDRVLDVVRSHRNHPARDIVTGLYDRVCDFCQGSPQRDDITSIVIKVL